MPIRIPEEKESIPSLSSTHPSNKNNILDRKRGLQGEKPRFVLVVG